MMRWLNHASSDDGRYAFQPLDHPSSRDDESRPQLELIVPRLLPLHGSVAQSENLCEMESPGTP
eukprot:4066917-Amphidinium_carterae.1